MSFGERCARVWFWAMILLMFAGVVICITGTQHNIEWYKELFVTVGMGVGIWVLGFILNKCRYFLREHEKSVLFLLLACFGIALYAVSYVSRNDPMYDYAVIYQSAYDYAHDGQANWGYLAQWGNNYGIFLWLVIIMKICEMLSIEDPFAVLLFINTALAVFSGFCLFDILTKFLDNTGVKFMGLLMYFGFLPLWGGTNYFYTDSVSMFFSIGAFWIVINFGDQLVGYLLGGILWAIGFELKATVAISMIAVEMVCVLKMSPQGESGQRKYGIGGKEYGTSRSGSLVGWLLMVFVFVICLLAMSNIKKAFPSQDYRDEYEVPMSYWVALGIHNDGSYPGNIEFAESLLQTKGYEAKNRKALLYIDEHISDLWNPDHYISKIRYNFASGKMGLSEFNQNPTTFMHELVNDYGKYGGFSTMFASAYFYAIILFGLYGAVRVLTGKAKDDLSSIVLLTVFGLFLFLMLWESNNRQLYNHIPWYAVFGALGLRFLYGGEKIDEK